MKNIENEEHALRGGLWYRSSALCRASSRGWGTPGNRGDGLGFRVLHRRRKP
jgi:formylglycine-generating enzyme required for sulfatase activity